MAEGEGLIVEVINSMSKYSSLELEKVATFEWLQ